MAKRGMISQVILGSSLPTSPARVTYELQFILLFHFPQEKMVPTPTPIPKIQFSAEKGGERAEEESINRDREKTSNVCLDFRKP